LKTLAQFEIFYFQFMDEASNLSSDVPQFVHDEKYLLKLYRAMLFSRLLDNKAIALQRTGRMGTYPSTRGQEAVFVGIGEALAADDVFFPYYRDIATLMLRGVSPVNIFLYWGGDERGNLFADALHNYPYTVPISSQLLHAVGVATALKIRQQKNAVLVTCGDGATSQGDFYEALNVAGVWQLPVVFVVINNQWAISVPRTAQTAACTLAQKAIAAGISGEQIDGNDVIAVRERVAVALAEARNNQRASVLEIVCYRHHDHTTADDASRYEAPGLRESEWQKEPIARLNKYLTNIKVLTPELDQQLHDEIAVEIEKITNEYLNILPEKPTAMFDNLYQTLPEAYSDQYDLIKAMQL